LEKLSKEEKEKRKKENLQRFLVNSELLSLMNRRWKPKWEKRTMDKYGIDPIFKGDEESSWIV